MRWLVGIRGIRNQYVVFLLANWYNFYIKQNRERLEHNIIKKSPGSSVE